MQHSIDLLRKAERLALAYDAADGYYLAFSGGKDSQALYHIAQIAGVKFRPHFSPTSVDPPEVIRFIREHYPDVEFQRLTKSIYQQAIELGILPTMRVRWCCEKFKEHAGAGKVTLIGIRHAESARRARRNEVEVSSRKFSGDLKGFDQWSKEERERKQQPRRGRKPKTPITPSLANPQEIKKESIVGCISGKESILVSPIIEWTDRDVWQFLNDVMQVPHCSLYDEGWRRLGCIICPMSQHAQKVKEMQRWPHVKHNWLKAIKAIRRGGSFPKDISGGTSRKRTSTGGGGLPIQTRADGRTHFYQRDIWTEETQSEQRNMGGFSQSSSSLGLTEEQIEDQIAENIFDWWISGKSYKKWYAEKFLENTLDFDFPTD